MTNFRLRESVRLLVSFVLINYNLSTFIDPRSRRDGYRREEDGIFRYLLDMRHHRDASMYIKYLFSNVILFCSYK